MKERLQKVLANLGLGSRREIEGWISEGRIKVNGEVAELGCQVDGTETVLLDDHKVSIENDAQERRVLIYYKPEGEITTRHDPEGRPTIFDSLPKIHNGRWITVGRLDINTQGLLLVTNDGELAHRLMHPSHELQREYAVRVIGEFTDEMADNMKKGVEFEDGLSKFEEILASGGTGANYWYHVTVKGGKNREVRRLWESQGLMVSRLIRIRYGNVELAKGLREGQFIDIDPEVLKELVESVGLTHQRVVLDERTERQRSKARRIGNQYDRQRELNRDHRSSPRREDGERTEGRPFERDSRSTRPEARSFDRDNRGSRPEGGRPFDRDNRGSRPEGGRSFDRSSRPDSRGSRPDGARPFDRDNRGSRPEGGRPFDRDNRGSRPEGGRPFDRDNRGSRPEGGRPFDRDNRGSRPEGGRPFDRDNRGSRPEGGRPFDRDSRGSRPEGGRPFDRDSRGSRPEGGRSFDRSSRPDSRGSRPDGGRSFDRSSRPDNRGSRPEGGRSFDRDSRPSSRRSDD